MSPTTAGCGSCGCGDVGRHKEGLGLSLLLATTFRIANASELDMDSSNEEDIKVLIQRF